MTHSQIDVASILADIRKNKGLVSASDIGLKNYHPGFDREALRVRVKNDTAAHCEQIGNATDALPDTKVKM